jgi:hypothetical protein
VSQVHNPRPDGVPGGFTHGETGARAAAVAYAEYPAIVVGLPVETAAVAQADVASDSARVALVAQTRQRLEQLYAAAPQETLSYRVAVLAASVSMSGVDRAHTMVWQVGVLTTPSGPIYAEWSTVTQDLVWEHNDWRVASEQMQPGPTPTPDPNSPPTVASELATQLAGFDAPQATVR